MLTGKELGAAIEAARVKKGVTKRALAEHFGVRPPSVQDWVQRGTIGKEKLPMLWSYFADVVGPSHWGLETYPTSDRYQADTPAVPLQAQEMSPPRYRVLPTIRWEDLMTREELPDLFATPAPDDSMAPRVREGQLVTLERGLEPRGGDGVLVRDRDGHTYLRLYRPRRPGIWEAHALNPDYQSLDSERDGLEVLAVIVGVHARWA
jgi:hypothetical protein